jgi:hypothetical protein
MGELVRWLKELWTSRGLNDLQPGQVVHVIGVGPVRVKDPQPVGPHSAVFSALRDGDQQANMYHRHEIKRDEP